MTAKNEDVETGDHIVETEDHPGRCGLTICCKTKTLWRPHFKVLPFQNVKDTNKYKFKTFTNHYVTLLLTWKCFSS